MNPIIMKNERLKELAEETQKLKERLAQIAEEEAQERQSDLHRVVGIFTNSLKDHGLSLEEAIPLLPLRSSRKASGKRKAGGGHENDSAVLYKNPDGPQTWGGIGRKPKWILAAEVRGLTLAELKAKS
jgi:DNA-binding protein H-NS